MHTPEQAKDLWCPMARVAQAGNADIHVAYNRSLTKQLKQVNLQAPAPPEECQLGQAEAKIITAHVLDATAGISMAANCIGDSCAMWRWAPAEETRTKMRTAPDPKKPGEVIEYPVQEYIKSAYGFCGLAGRPDVF